jgi:hypothetical protein
MNALALLLAAGPALLANPDDAKARTKLDAPGIDAQVTTLSPTKRPFVVANGWRFRRQPGGKWLYEVPAGGAALAAAEAAAFGADALIKGDPKDRDALERMLRFARALPAGPEADVAQIGVVDDGSEAAGEVMTLLARRNLLWKPERASDHALPINIQLGTPRYPRKAASDPSELAGRIRRELSDDKRLLRVYGSEVILCRVAGDARRVRVHLLNYGTLPGDGIRIRLLGKFRPGIAYTDLGGSAPALDVQVASGATELTVPRFAVYAVVDLDRAP